MARVERIYGADFNGYLSSLKDSARDIDSPLMSTKLKELCEELEPVVKKLTRDYRWPGMSDEADKWLRKLDDLQGALAACATADGVGSLCRPFYDKIERLIGDCRQQRAQAARGND